MDHIVTSILSNKELWSEDLTTLEGFAVSVTRKLKGFIRHGSLHEIAAYSKPEHNKWRMVIISKDTFSFLTKIKTNNNRPWFEKNRPLYEKARAEYLGFMTGLVEGIRKIESIPEKEPVKIYA